MAADTLTIATAIIGAASGLLGSFLGIMNARHQFQRNKIRLKVIPQHAIPVGAIRDAPINFGIEVINLSDFPVVLVDVGFQLRDGRYATLSTVKGIESNGRLPLKLEPRTAYSKNFWLDHETVDLKAVKCAYARTQCGTTASGMSPALKQMIEERDCS